MPPDRYSWVLGLAMLGVYLWAMHARAAALVKRKLLLQRTAQRFLRIVSLAAGSLAMLVVLAQRNNAGSSAICAYYGNPMTPTRVTMWITVFSILGAALVTAVLPQAGRLVAALWPVVAVARPIERSLTPAHARWRLAAVSLILGAILASLLAISITAPEQFPC